MLDAIDQDIFVRQTRRYAGHEFTTLTGEPIFVSKYMSLAEAVHLYNDITRQLGQFPRDETALEKLRGYKEVAHAEAMAAFYRAAQCWPKDAKDALGL